jgi:hypothetical protein
VFEQPVDPIPKLSSVVFDNSALTDLLGTDDNLAKFENRIKSGCVRALVPFDALIEAASGSNIEAMHGRLVKLAVLVEKYPNHVFLTRDASVWINHEWLNGGVLRDIPHFRNSPRFPGVIDMLKDKEEFVRIYGAVADSRSEGQESKLALEDRDNKFRERAVSSLPKDEPLEIMKTLRDRVQWTGLSSFEGSLASLPRFSRTKLRKALHSPSKFKVLRTYLSLYYIRALANAVDPSICPPEYQKLIKIEKGNWYDLGLIAAAASQHFLITNDKGQIAVTEFAHERGFVKCRAKKLSEWLALSH